MNDVPASRTRYAEQAVEEFVSLPLISEFVFRSLQTIDGNQKEVADLMVSHSGMGLLISQKCQEDPDARKGSKLSAWVTKNAKKAAAQLRGALRTAKNKPIWCDHRRRGRVELVDGLPPIDHALVILEVSERIELVPAADYPTEFEGTPLTYLSVNDFLNLVVELRTLPELLQYLSSRRSLPPRDLRTVGAEKEFFQYYLFRGGIFDEGIDYARVQEMITSHKAEINGIRALKADSDRYSKILEFVADKLAERLPSYAADLPEKILRAFDESSKRTNYLQMQEVLANLHLRERADLGRAFLDTVELLREKAAGFVYKALHLDARPEWIFVFAASKDVHRRDVLERGLILINAAMAFYCKKRAMLIVDRDGSGFEVAMGTQLALGPTKEDIAAGKKLFGDLKMKSQKISFIPEIR